MVHALKEAWGVLRKNGTLIDLRPLHANVSIEAILDEQSILITRYTDEYRDANDKAADNAIMLITGQNLFRLEASAPFEYVRFYDTGKELLDYFAERNPPIIQPDDVIEKIQIADINSTMTLRVGTPMHLKTYRRIHN